MILAVDTATRWTSLALHDGKSVISEIGWYAVNRQTVELAPTVHDMLQKTGIAPGDLKALAVAIGPGSYTGLRVGLGFAKGLALAQNLPIIGINTLEVIVAGYGVNDENLHMVPVCEAGRKRVCAALYRWYSRRGWQVKREADIYDWETLIADMPERTRFVGEISAEARSLIRQSDKSLRADTPAAGVRHAAQLAELAWTRLKKRDIDDAASLTPIYLREPGGGKTAA